MTYEIVIIVAAFIVGIVASRFYTKHRGPLLIKHGSSEPEENVQQGGSYKDLKAQGVPEGYEIFFMPSLYATMLDAEQNFGKPLNSNEFNRVKNLASAILMDEDDVRDTEAERGGSPNDFTLTEWQKWQEDDSAP